MAGKPSKAGLWGQARLLSGLEIHHEDLPVGPGGVVQDLHEREMLAVGCGEGRPVHSGFAGDLLAVAAVTLHREDLHGHAAAALTLIGALPGAGEDGVAVGKELRAALLPVLGEGDLLLVRAVRLHDPKIHLSVEVAAEQNPLAVRGIRGLRVVHLVVGQPLHVAPFEVGSVDLRAFRIIVRIGPGSLGEVGQIASRGPQQALAIGREEGARVFALVVDLHDIGPVDRGGIDVMGGVGSDFRVADHALVVRREIELRAFAEVRNDSDRQLGRS